MQARQLGIPVVMDAGSVYADSARLLAHVDYLVASEKFARAFCASEYLDTCLHALARQHAQVVITCGERGVLWAKDGDDGHLPAFKVQVVDSTGAGDAFHGAFAWGLAQKMDWLPLLRFASAVAALNCIQLGARLGLPSLQAVQRFLRENEHA